PGDRFAQFGLGAPLLLELRHIQRVDRREAHVEDLAHTDELTLADGPRGQSGRLTSTTNVSVPRPTLRCVRGQNSRCIAMLTANAIDADTTYVSFVTIVDGNVAEARIVRTLTGIHSLGARTILDSRRGFSTANGTMRSARVMRNAIAR